MVDGRTGRVGLHVRVDREQEPELVLTPHQEMVERIVLVMQLKLKAVHRVYTMEFM